MTKYVIFQYKAGILMPVLIPHHVTHSQVSLIDATPVSAGFFRYDKGFVEVLPMKSESLKLGPAEGDDRLLQGVLDGMPTSFYL